MNRRFRHTKRFGGVLAAGGLVCLLASVTASAAASRSVPGWGSPATFLGRYHIVPVAGQTTSQAPTPAGIFTVAVNTAARVAAAGYMPTGGELTVFLRKVKTGEPLQPSGILSVVTPSGNFVLYLTQLESAGAARSAVVNQGAFVGAPIGSLTGVSTAPEQLTARVSAQGIAPFTVRFVRFSASPVP